MLDYDLPKLRFILSLPSFPPSPLLFSIRAFVPPQHSHAAHREFVNSGLSTSDSWVTYDIHPKEGAENANIPSKTNQICMYLLLISLLAVKVTWV